MVPITVIGFVITAFILFIIFYLSRSVKIVNRLKKYTYEINNIANDKLENQRELLKNLLVQPEFKHAWSEFSESLHPQSELVGSEEKIVKIRATAPSASFFSEQQLVDIPLNTEFF